MRATVVVIGLLFSVVEMVLIGGSNDIGVAVGFFGLVASLALIVSRRIGFALFVMTALLALLALFWVEIVVYAGLAYLTWRLIRQHRINEERAERADRYIRQQLGE